MAGPTDFGESIETAFGAAIAAGKIRGAVICATDAAGNFVYDRALGERTLLSGEKRPQQLDDILYLASATKLITTVIALQCVEDGLLTLAGDLSALAPELARKQVLPPEGSGASELEPAARPITLEMLLTHTAGTAYGFLVPRLAAWREAHKDAADDGAARDPLAFQPGTGWMYGSGLDWAALVVERATGTTVDELVRRRVCAPLGIAPEDAQFYPVQGDAARARMVDLNPDDPEGLGRAVIGGAGLVKNSTGPFGGHGLFMTGAAYVKVLRSLLANDGKLLRPETVEDMFRDHVGAEAAANFRAAMEGPGSEFFRVGTAPGSRVGYGLGGLLTLENVEGWYGERTLTWGGGFTFTWFIDRKNDLCGLGAVQAALPLDFDLVAELKQTFRYDIYRKHAAWKKERQQAA
ncbi:uncharacterized protein THITE_2111226 [Thermothielavioides terrestris NRRL 8126]|uniref:Beta-lactamase-related domain-containing protein n=1 Tax=Thermothielavioides terrestris (strain ATCC 38088 / NRRL 8126) TaxID=578455 RepID=G2R1D8_THETT|nr:uncharacterized protein THITE_2111226 [Thermothielavioides terrestris NRRL 8126]AEO64873.1 hypothetical protein THITE_2111226 [Thermothielavioides terrestris NRRL 8126]